MRVAIPADLAKKTRIAAAEDGSRSATEWVNTALKWIHETPETREKIAGFARRQAESDGVQVTPTP